MLSRFRLPAVRLLSSSSSTGSDIGASSSTASTASATTAPRVPDLVVQQRFRQVTDASIPQHVPKFIRDTIQGLDPQQGELSALEYHTQMGYFVERLLSKRELAQTMHVQPRDLRKVLSASQRRLISGVAVRNQCIILHLEHIKAVIMSDRMFLFDHQRDSRVKTFSLFLPSLLYEPRGTQSLLGSANVAPFELRALEAVLIEVTESLDSMLKEMTPRMLELLHDLTVVQSTANLSALVSANDSLSSFDARVQSLRHALTELLNNDEDLAGLFLTEKHEIQDHDEAEELIENYLMQVEETAERISELQTRFRNVMSYIQIHFDSQRNRLMRMNLVVSIGALSMATTATGAGLFGMNLASGFESNPAAFVTVSSTLVGAGAVMFVGAYAMYRKSKRLDVVLSRQIATAKQRGTQAAAGAAGVVVPSTPKGDFSQPPPPPQQQQPPRADDEEPLNILSSPSQNAAGANKGNKTSF
jgi:hypothetical protein